MQSIVLLLLTLPFILICKFHESLLHSTKKPKALIYIHAKSRAVKFLTNLATIINTAEKFTVHCSVVDCCKSTNI